MSLIYIVVIIDNYHVKWETVDYDSLLKVKDIIDHISIEHKIKIRSFTIDEKSVDKNMYLINYRKMYRYNINFLQFRVFT